MKVENQDVAPPILYFFSLNTEKMMESVPKVCPRCKLSGKKYYKNRARKEGISVYCSDCESQIRMEKQKIVVQLRLSGQYMENESWKDAVEFEGYEVSTEGRIRNKSTKLLLTPSQGCSGYAVTSIRGQNIKFHRIVAQTFLPNIHQKETVEHKDDNKMNNRLWNLKWATHREQQQFVKEKNSRGAEGKLRQVFPSIQGEVWKDVADYPDYQVSSCGRVKYPIRKRSEPHSLYVTYGGRSGMTFSFRNVDDRHKKIGIHRIVASTFLPNPNKYEIVNHKDGNKTNNRISNLEWCTRKQNTKHAYDNNLISGKRSIFQLDENNNIIQKWNTIKEATEECKIGRTSINKVLSRRGKTAGGYYWCYSEDYNPVMGVHTKYDTNKKQIQQLLFGDVVQIWDSISEASEHIAVINNASVKGN